MLPALVSGISHPHRWKLAAKWQCLLCAHLPCLTKSHNSDTKKSSDSAAELIACVYYHGVHYGINAISPLFIFYTHFIVRYVQNGWIKYFNDLKQISAFPLKLLLELRKCGWIRASGCGNNHHYPKYSRPKVNNCLLNNGGFFFSHLLLVHKLNHSNAASQTFTEGHKPKVSVNLLRISPLTGTRACCIHRYAWPLKQMTLHCLTVRSFGWFISDSLSDGCLHGGGIHTALD